jgi:hypothetical protein
MVVLFRQQSHRVADADALGALGDGPVQDFGGGAVGKLVQEMVFDRPEIVEPNLVAQFRLGHDLVVAVALDARIVGLGYLNLIHHAEFHGCFLPTIKAQQ